MKKCILLIVSLVFLFPNTKSLGQTPAIADNFMPGANYDLGPLSDKYSPLYQELMREQNYRFGDFYLRKRDAYLRKHMNNLRAGGGPVGLRDYNNFGGVQYFGIMGGLGINTLYSKRLNRDWRVNFNLGFLSISNSYMSNRFMNTINPNLAGLNSSILILPSYIGVQRNINSKHIPKKVNIYVEAGAGPVIGMNMPYGYGFFGSFTNAQYRLTPGGFVGGGVNAKIHNGYYAFADVKYHVMVFNGNLGYTNNYSTPSVFFGISRGFSFRR